jgi:hypothetical protein
MEILKVKSGRSPRARLVGHAEATRLALAPLGLRVLHSRSETVVIASTATTTVCKEVALTTARSVRKLGLLHHQNEWKLILY